MDKEQWEFGMDHDQKSFIAYQQDNRSEMSDTQSQSSRKRRILKLKAFGNRDSQECEQQRNEVAD